MGFSSVPKPCPNVRDNDDRAEREGAGEARRCKSFDRRGFLISSSSSPSRERARLRLLGGVFEEGWLDGPDNGDDVRGALSDCVGGRGLTTLLTTIFVAGENPLKRSFGGAVVLRLCPDENIAILGGHTSDSKMFGQVSSRPRPRKVY